MCVGVSVWLGWSACNTDTTPTQPHRNSKTHRTKNNATNVVIQQNSRKLLMVDILMSETCWAHTKLNTIASDIKFIFYSSTITMMHGPINILQRSLACFRAKASRLASCSHLLLWVHFIFFLTSHSLPFLVFSHYSYIRLSRYELTSLFLSLSPLFDSRSSPMNRYWGFSLRHTTLLTIHYHPILPRFCNFQIQNTLLHNVTIPTLMMYESGQGSLFSFLSVVILWYLPL